ncbi:unnamed protein product [Microthlaspi erraticum]|uniref:Uncharacterized protein n=1 Tax=Microthlaspi erraticum TaxID=1685480 RepID=A0A6D2JG40_9BRAS|nr:unnamed protein product [Microthlaspi erraticum]
MAGSGKGGRDGGDGRFGGRGGRFGGGGGGGRFGGGCGRFVSLRYKLLGGLAVRRKEVKTTGKNEEHHLWKKNESAGSGQQANSVGAQHERLVDRFRDTIQDASGFGQRNYLPVCLQDQMVAHLCLRYRTDLEEYDDGEGEGFRSFVAVESLNVSVAAGFFLHHLIGNKASV